jgi:hypothetical protein
MQSTTQAAPTSKKMLWTGRSISALIVLFMLFGFVFGLTNAAVAQQGLAHMGYPQSAGLIITILMLVSTTVYAIPGTSVLGAILLTGYLGGATATHVRIGEPFYFPVIVGVLVWVGLYLREDRLRALVPWRR